MPQVTIRMLRNPAKSIGCPLLEGETGPVEPSLAERLMALNLAVNVEQPKQIHGVPDATKIMADEAAPLPEETKPDEPALPVTSRKTKLTP